MLPKRWNAADVEPMHGQAPLSFVAEFGLDLLTFSALAPLFVGSPGITGWTDEPETIKVSDACRFKGNVAAIGAGSILGAIKAPPIDAENDATSSFDFAVA